MPSDFEKDLSASLKSLNRNVNELIWANIFHDAIKGCQWLDEKNFAINPGRWAVGYNYFYVVFRVLNEFKPQKILELGLGQSSRLIGQYAKTHDCRHDIVEHDADFVGVSKRNFNFSENTKFNVVNLTRTEIKMGGVLARHLLTMKKDLKTSSRVINMILFRLMVPTVARRCLGLTC